jgi:toxin ParE1/3/4
MRIVWSDAAKGELAAQIRYIAERNRDAARRQRTVIHEAVRRLRDFSRLGRPGDLAGTRELVIAGTPFIVVYEELSGDLVILHVYHGRQD